MKIQIKKYKSLVALFWVILYCQFLFQALPQTSVTEALLFPLFLLVTAYPFTMYLSKNLLNKAMKSRKWKAFIIQLIIFSIIVGGIFLFYLFLFNWFTKVGISEPTDYFNIEDYPWYFFTIFLSAGVLINVCFCCLQFYYAHYYLEKEHLESQLQVLKGQINPHFMFNVLNHINYYVEKKDDLASPLLLKYADILRYQLYSGKKDEVSIREEIQFLKDFVDIEKIRWEDKLDITCVWNMEDENRRVPPLLFIPLVENAFKHVYRGANSKGYINIIFEQHKRNICLEVENSKKTMQTNIIGENSGIGLDNLKNRLDILYNHNYKLSIKETETTYYSKLEISL
ncbi:MAG: histidine kinase [Dysgonomonas sp.]|nr:histidine kinase [Dysgonomonas sp.]